MAEIQRKIGIMGGTFDPIHIGHLVTAEAVRMDYGLDEVLFIPAANPPHKQRGRVTQARHRYIMTLLATYSNPHFSVSDIELERPGLSYSIDTVEALLTEYGAQTEFYFIVGADAVKELDTWHDIDRLFTLCHFIAATRPGCIWSLEDAVRRFGERGRERIHRLATPELEISSTDIRERVRQGHSIQYIVPEAVEKYIKKEGLYTA